MNDRVTDQHGKFRKRPVVIDAMLWNGHNATQIVKWAFGGWAKAPEGKEFWLATDGTLVIPTLEGEMRASPGDWIIKGVKGEFYPCKPDIFAATYEAA